MKKKQSLLAYYGFHEWLAKTNFSFLKGASHPKDMMRRAQDLSYQSICINDYDGVYGLARCYRENKSYQEKHTQQQQMPLKLNSGVEIHLNEDHHLPILLQQTLVLLALSAEGYKNLCRIVSLSHQKSKNKAYVSIAQLLSCKSKDLVAILPMRGQIRCGLDPLEQMRWHGQLFEHFQGRFYFAISRHQHPSEDLWIKQQLDFAKHLQAPCLLSQDAFFHHKNEKVLSDLLHSIRNNQVFAKSKAHFFPNDERSLHPLPYLEKLFKDLPIYQSALLASYQLNQCCDFSLSQLRYHYPKEMLPEGYTPQAYLEELTWQGALSFYQKKAATDLPSKLLQTLKNELNLIEQLNFADYFLTVWDIVRWARSQKILCQGRGSAANSAVCFVLGITAVDPTHFDLLFERFISMERGDPPDIDVDFEHERREEVIQYIYRRYGRNKAAMVANVITFRRKGAIRAVGKALGINETLIGHATKLSRTKQFRSQATMDLMQALKKKYGHLYSNKSISWSLWQQLSDRLEGFPRHMGIHSGGFMLADRELDYLLPQEPATMEGRSIIQWSKEDIEALGFFKIDILALGMLSALRKCFAYIQRYYGRDLDMTKIPANDEATYRMIQAAETVGTFQIESRAQMSMLPRLRPHCFYDLVIEVAIIRPGPIQGKVIHPFLARRQGLQPIDYVDERLKPILERTLGVTIFQEQAMRIAIAVGNFSPGEANELRKNIGAWNNKQFTRNVSPWLIKLQKGMRENGIKEDFIQQLLGQMSGFSEYGFPESHAVSFALLAYASSYLKCHYPAAFYCAILNSQPMGFYSPHVLLQSAQRDGIKVLALSIHHSKWDCTLEPLANKKYAYAIRLGFRLINGLSQKGGERLVKERQKRSKKGQFAWQNYQEFLHTTKLARDDLSALAAARVFDEFKQSRANSLWLAEAAPFNLPIDVQESELQKRDIQESDIQETQLNWQQETELETIKYDFQAFNTSLGRHPISLMKEEQWLYPIKLQKIKSSHEFIKLKANSDVFVFGMVLAKQAPPSAKGMVFVTLEDEAGFINLAFTPQVYQRDYDLIEQQSFLCLVGKLQRSHQYHSILVKRVFAQGLPNNTLVLKPKEKKKEIESKQFNPREAANEGRANQQQLIKPRFYY